MRLEANITRSAPTLGFICDVKRHDKAIAEAEDYDFRMISPGYYLCIHGENAYAMSAYLKKAGCACADMTFRCKGNEACKHIQIFCTLNDLPTKPIDDGMRQLLTAAGWSGETLTPPDHPSTRHQKRGRPNAHDPARKPQPQAASRAEQKQSYAGKTPEQIIRATPIADLKKFAGRGAPMAIAELRRRETERAVI